MPNRLVSIEEISSYLQDSITKQGDVRAQRAYVYDLQTSIGGFQHSEEERNRYIEIGRVK